MMLDLQTPPKFYKRFIARALGYFDHSQVKNGDVFSMIVEDSHTANIESNLEPDDVLYVVNFKVRVYFDGGTLHHIELTPLAEVDKRIIEKWEASHA